MKPWVVGSEPTTKDDLNSVALRPMMVPAACEGGPSASQNGKIKALSFQCGGLLKPPQKSELVPDDGVGGFYFRPGKSTTAGIEPNVNSEPFAPTFNVTSAA